jgi:MFS family permease
MAERLDYTEVHPENRWKILRAQWRFALWALYTSIGSINFGFDLTAGLLMVAIGPFQKQYGIPYNSVLGDYLIPARWQAGWNAAACGGDGVGCFVAIFLLNRIGRKPVIWIGCAFSVVGIGLQQASHEWKLFLVGRLINGIGFGMVYTFSPVWYPLSKVFVDSGLVNLLVLNCVVSSLSFKMDQLPSDNSS